NALKDALTGEYVVLSLDFQAIGNTGFSSEEVFVQEFSRLVWNRRKLLPGMPEEIADTLRTWKNAEKPKVCLGEFFDLLTDWCDESPQGIVLMIDEVDSASNNQVFLDFLAQLRNGYIHRDTDNLPAFQSVILAGVNDIGHLKSKIQDESQHRVNSPWNIAAEFAIDMSLSEVGIQGLLAEYEADRHTGMDTGAMAKLLWDYTSGYPFLVSRLCELMDKKISVELGSLADAWTGRGMDEAVKRILTENNALFQSLTGKLVNYPELKASLRRVLMEGERIPYNFDNEPIAQMETYGFIKNENGKARVANRIFETRLYNLFLSDEEIRNNSFFKEGDLAGNIFVKDGKLDMPLIMERFIAAFHQIYGPLEERFKEKDGRELFLLYLRPIINGVGNYYIEAQTRDQKRTDVIVDYLGNQYIIELKIWHGERYNAEGEVQIKEYLDYWNLDTGYMLSFNFNKNKQTGVEKKQVGEKILFEGTV
ncbi:MAG: AAA-like domain-containing protein, partial [Lachnospiraceae bacterium]|nr:AAA-like domain-containing protein [Lachnospiraceae bacterium]